MHNARWTVGILLLLLAGLIATGGAAHADDKEVCRKSSGDAAVAACTRAIEGGTYQGKNLSALYFWRAAEWADQGKYDRAIKDYEESYRIDPGDTSSLLQLGNAYRASGNLDGAIESYSRAIKQKSDSLITRYQRASAYRVKGDFDLAIEDYNAMLALDSEDADVYNARGIAYAAKGDIDGAIEDYGIAISLDPKFAFAYSNRGDARKSNDDINGAIADYSEATKLAPKDPVPVYKRAVLRRARGDYDGALEDFGTVIRLAEKEADGFYERGVTYLLKRDYDRAITDLDQAIQISPRRASAWHMRGLAYAAKNEPERSIADYSEAIRLEPENAERYTVRAWQSLRMGRPLLALMDADIAVSLNPSLTGAYATRMRIYETLGEAEAAEADKKAAEAALLKRRMESDGSEVYFKAKGARAHDLQGLEALFAVRVKAKFQDLKPVERTAIALGQKYNARDVFSYDSALEVSILTDRSRKLLADFQRKYNLAPTGYLNDATFEKVLEAPINVDLFRVERPIDGTPLNFGAWHFGRGDDICTVWARPSSITGKFIPRDHVLPLINISRFVDEKGSEISARFAATHFYKKGAKVYILADGSRLETEESGGYFHPPSEINNRGRSVGSGDIFKALAKSHSFKVVGPSKFGGELVVEYSTDGFTRAFRHMDRKCAHGRIGVWIR